MPTNAMRANDEFRRARPKTPTVTETQIGPPADVRAPQLNISRVVGGRRAAVGALAAGSCTRILIDIFLSANAVTMRRKSRREGRETYGVSCSSAAARRRRR
ncbi:hypothetical protein EVAR_74617_1 [Eumeta japonica]|uniref:Uncharacterized protein n=1 Tax=Eumeta variegata TaxID=151549 RepID=A0A4C1WCA6_EUMVA|nr:hypothetical protein EVAR_74617_1 [Eumeta japonica]